MKTTKDRNSLVNFASDENGDLAVLENVSAEDGATFLNALTQAIASTYTENQYPIQASVAEYLKAPSVNISDELLKAAEELDKRWRSECLAVCAFLSLRIGALSVQEEALSPQPD